MSVSAPTPPTLGALLARRDLGLELVAQPDVERALAHPIRWAHTSDLIDPTPFLGEEMVLLTTGGQFADEDARAMTRYVRRLAERGVVALGFGVGVVRVEVPAALTAACRTHNLALFTVPYRTPFLAVARAVAEELAAESYARRTWALSAQRAVSLAALRQDGLGQAIAELSRQLDAPVALFDAAGAVVRSAGTIDLDTRAELSRWCTTLVGRGAAAASIVPTALGEMTLQTLGPGGDLRGVLVIGLAGLDEEARSVVTAVVALTGFALEQDAALARARGTLRAGAVRALLDGRIDLAESIVDAAWGGLPRGRAVVAVTDSVPPGLAAYLEVRAGDGDGFFFGTEPDGAILILSDAEHPFDPQDLVERFDVRVGVSAPTELTGVATALTEAKIACRHGDRVTSFTEIAAGGVLQTLRDEAGAVAARMLAPLVEHDAHHGTDLVHTLHGWLAHDSHFDRTATDLGVHRHTVRTRIRLIERLLERDLAAFADRADVWAALLAARVR